MAIVLWCPVLQGMRIELEFEGGKNAAGIYVHKKLPEAMGNSVAAFAHAVLSGHTKPGVWYPEEKEALAVSGKLAVCGCALCCRPAVGAATVLRLAVKPLPLKSCLEAQCFPLVLVVL